MKISLLLMVLLALTGCAESNIYQEKQRILDSWVGKKADQLIEVFGIPDREKDVSPFHYEQFDHRCISVGPSTAENLGASLRVMAQSINTSVAKNSNDSMELGPSLHVICDRWLFKFKEGVIYKSFAGWQSSAGGTSAGAPETNGNSKTGSRNEICAAGIPLGQEVIVSLTNGKSIEGKLMRCDSQISVRSKLLFLTYDVFDVKSVIPAGAEIDTKKLGGA